MSLGEDGEEEGQLIPLPPGRGGTIAPLPVGEGVQTPPTTPRGRWGEEFDMSPGGLPHLGGVHLGVGI